MRLRKHRWWVFLVVVGLIATACGDDDTSSPPETVIVTSIVEVPGETVTVTSIVTETSIVEVEVPAPTEPPPALTPVRYGLPTSRFFITTVGVMFALDNGFFEDEGLDVTVDPLPGSTTAIRSLLAGDHDIVLTGGDTAYNAWNNGASVKIISSPVARGTDVMFANSDITSIQDMAGKRFAISDPGSTAEVLGRIIFERNGVDPDSIEWVAIGNPTDRVTAMIAGTVDATAATILSLTPVIEAIANGDMRVLTSFAEEFPDIPLAYNVTSDRYLRDNADVVERFLRAEIRGYCWAQQNPAEAAAIAVKYIEETPLELLENAMQGMADLGAWGIDGGITEAGIGATQEALISLGNLDSAVEVTDVAVFDIVQRAAAAVDCQG